MLNNKFIPNEIVIYYYSIKKHFFFIIVSNVQGWSIINLKYKLIVIRNNKFYVYNLLLYIKTYNTYLTNIFLGYLKNYSQYVRVKGMGYKVVTLNTILLVKLGFSHRILYLFTNDFRLNYLNKQLLIFKSRCTYLLKQNIYLFQHIRKINSYKKKGIYIKGALIKVKINTKKSKF
jgi:ribosomal protein L6P/L9E